MKQKLLVRSLIVAGMISGATLGGYIAQSTSTLPNALAAAGVPTYAAAPVASVQPGARVAVPDFTTIVEENGAAVVNISVTGKASKTESTVLITTYSSELI